MPKMPTQTVLCGQHQHVMRTRVLSSMPLLPKLLLLAFLAVESSAVSITISNKSSFSSFSRVLHQLVWSSDEIKGWESSAFARTACEAMSFHDTSPNCISALGAVHEAMLRELDLEPNPAATLDSKTYNVDLELPLWIYHYVANGTHHETIFGVPSNELWPSATSSDKSLNAVIDAAARSLNVVKSESTDLVFVSPSLFVSENSKGRGVFASSPIPAYVLVELAPALLVQKSVGSLHDLRFYPDAPVTVLRDYMYPSPVPHHMLVVMGWAMLYNHCPKDAETVNWEWVRYEKEGTGTAEDDVFRYVGFAVRFYTVKDVPLHGELCCKFWHLSVALNVLAHGCSYCFLTPFSTFLSHLFSPSHLLFPS